MDSRMLESRLSSPVVVGLLLQRIRQMSACNTCLEKSVTVRMTDTSILSTASWKIHTEIQ
jgi:hypothetical protein